MKISRDRVNWSFFLGLFLSLSMVMALGCQSLQQSRRNQWGEQWICPEYADLPLREKHYEIAIERHLKVVAQEPDNALAHYHMGYAYVQLGFHDDGIAEYLKALDLGLVRGHLFYNLGMAYWQLGRYQQAEQAFVRAIEIEPEYGDNHRALGLAQLEQGHFIDAMASCREATKLAPDDSDSWHCLAVAAAKGDEVGESWYAVKQLRRLDADYMLDPILLEIFPSEKR